MARRPTAHPGDVAAGGATLSFCHRTRPAAQRNRGRQPSASSEEPMDGIGEAGDGGILAQLSNDLASAVERAGTGTVTVNARQRMPASGIIWSDDGYIVTANHVVERDDEITVDLPDGRKVDAKLIGREPGSDIA